MGLPAVAEGIAVGVNDGDAVALMDGTNNGDELGGKESVAVGATVGRAAASIAGGEKGAITGVFVSTDDKFGISEGIPVGATVGEVTGTTVGAESWPGRAPVGR